MLCFLRKSSSFFKIQSTASKVKHLRLTSLWRPRGSPSLTLQVSPQRKRRWLSRELGHIDLEREQADEGEKSSRVSNFMRGAHQATIRGSRLLSSAIAKRLERYGIPLSSELHFSSHLSRMGCTKSVSASISDGHEHDVSW